MAYHIILYQPEIPPNTGNIMRLCANIGAMLHLIHPLGFVLNDKTLRRAGMDYRAQIDFVEYEHFEAFKRAYPTMRLFACTTKGQTCYTQPNFKPGDGFLFGPETRGLPESILETFLPEQRLRIPMREGSRSLNLSNSAAVVLYEAWRQVGFAVV